MAPPDTSPPGPDGFRHPRYNKLKIAGANAAYEFFGPALQAFFDALIDRQEVELDEKTDSASAES